MRKLVVGAFMTLDGVVQAPGAPDEDREGGFEHGGWVVPLFDSEFIDIMMDQAQRSTALLLGRKTYDIFAASWPHRGSDDPIANHLNSVPKYVASRTLKSVEWNNSTLITGDVASAVSTLKQGDGGEIGVSGSGTLVQTLLKHDLVDEFNLLVFPVVIGSGKRLFGDGAMPRSLKLVESRTTGTGIFVATYRRTGDLAVAAYGAEQEEMQKVPTVGRT